MIKYKKLDVDLLEYHEKNNMKQASLNLINQNSLKKKAAQIFQKKELPGQSPIKGMVLGFN